MTNHLLMGKSFEFFTSVHCPGSIDPPRGAGWFYVSSFSNTIQKVDGDIATFVSVTWARTKPPEAQADVPNA